MDFAVVEFVVEPSDGFLVALDVPGIDADAEHQRFIEWAVFGLLDVAMVAEPYPLKEMKVTVVRAEFDAVSSNQVAFRLAGRDAGRKLMAELQKPNLSRA